MQTSCPLLLLLQWVSAKTTSEGRWNRWGVKYIHAHTDTHTVCDALWARIACEALLLRGNAGLIQCNRIVIINQKPVNEEKQCLWVCNATQSELRQKLSYIQRLPMAWEKGEEDGGCEAKHRRRILAQKRCRGSNTPGMVKSWGGQEKNRRREEDQKSRRGKRGIGKESRKGNKPTGLHNILFKWTLNKNIVYRSRKHLNFK